MDTGARTPPPGPSKGGPRRPSSEFDALERDFFAREADLYKEETNTGETFEDVERKTTT
jgi:hypothetical protein